MVTKPRRMRWAGHVARMGEKCVQSLAGKPEENRPLGILRRSWEDNIRIDLREIRCETVDWIQVAEDRDQWRVLVNRIMNLRVL
jgi:hypothetical protein